jgi:hypothetical protein
MQTDLPEYVRLSCRVSAQIKHRAETDASIVGQSRQLRASLEIIAPCVGSDQTTPVHVPSLWQPPSCASFGPGRARPPVDIIDVIALVR